MTTKEATLTSQPKRRIRPSRLVIYLVLLLAASFYLLPVYVLVVTSLKSFQEVNLYEMFALPSSIGFDSFVLAWQGKYASYRGLSDSFVNSIKVTVPATILSALVGSVNGYLLTKWKFKGANLVFSLFLFGMFIPYQSVLIPLVQILSKMGLYDSIPGLILTHVLYAIPITTLIFRNYYAGIPTELIEASRIDGANIFGIYRHVLFPLSLPGFVVVIIWQFTSIWNDFLFAVTLIGDPATQPMTVALNNLAGPHYVEWNVQMAGALLTALPTLVVYLLLGRFFMRGLLAGSLKG